MNVGAHMVNS